MSWASFKRVTIDHSDKVTTTARSPQRQGHCYRSSWCKGTSVGAANRRNIGFCQPAVVAPRSGRTPRRMESYMPPGCPQRYPAAPVESNSPKKPAAGPVASVQRLPVRCPKSVGNAPAFIFLFYEISDINCLGTFRDDKSVNCRTGLYCIAKVLSAHFRHTYAIYVSYIKHCLTPVDILCKFNSLPRPGPGQVSVPASHS